MHDMAVFMEVATLRAKPTGRDVSLSALEMHVRVVDYTVHTECPGFISDRGLDVVAPGALTTMAAVELCLVRWWRRLDGGYVISDDELIKHMAQSSWTRKVVARVATASRRVWKALNSESVLPF